MPLEKRSISLQGHRTSVALEPVFWAEIDRLAVKRQISLARLVGEVDVARGIDGDGLASALRVLVLQDLIDQRAAETLPEDQDIEQPHD